MDPEVRFYGSLEFIFEEYVRDDVLYAVSGIRK